MSRDHQQIIVENGGAKALAEKLFALPAYRAWASIDDLANTIQGWKRSNSIPPEYWPDLKALEVSTLVELADAIAKARPPAPRSTSRKRVAA